VLNTLKESDKFINFVEADISEYIDEKETSRHVFKSFKPGKLTHRELPETPGSNPKQPMC
jgi:hypothetical protein